MPRHALARVLSRVLGISFLVALPSAASGALVLVNNGSAPPDPANVIAAGETTQADGLAVRNVGCTGTGACASPGDPTAVRVDPGAQLGSADAYDSSQLEVAGGQIGFGSVGVSLLTARDDSSVTMTAGVVSDAAGSVSNGSFTLAGGWLGSLLFAENQSRVTMTGGEIAYAQAYDTATIRILGGRARGGARAFSNSRIRIEGGLLDTAGNHEELLPFATSVITVVGTGFAVDGSPVGYAPIPATSGQLTGTLASGDPIDIAFRHAGATAALTGQIVLAAPAAPVPALGALPRLALALLLAGLVLAGAPRRRRSLG